VDDRSVRLEATVEQLRLAIHSLQQRVDLLEANAAATATRATEVPGGDAAQRQPNVPFAGLTRRDPYDPIVVVSLIGRLFLVLAGGFFLRAMTEAGLLAAQIGIALAFAYGLGWLYLADRAGQRQHGSSAVFHALAAAMVAFPLLVEATIRFKVLTGAGSTLGIAVLTAAFLFVARRQRLQAVAWVTVIAALPTSLILMAKTGAFVPFAFYLIAVGVATLWLGYSLGWTVLGWPTALTADVVVAGLALRALGPQHHDGAQVAMLLQWSLLAAYVISIAVRTLVRGRNVTLFEVVQTAAALVIAFGGTIVLTRTTGTLPAAIGVTSLVFGAVCYGVTFAFIERRQGLERNLYFYSSMALVLVLAGFTIALREPWLGTVLAVLGVLAAGSWSRVGRLYMLLHGVAYLLAASIVSGALAYGARALATASTGPWAVPGVVILVVLVASALSAGLVAARPWPEGGIVAGSLRVLVVMVLVWVACGWLVGWLVPAVAGLADRSVDLGAVATVRTCVLTMAALLIAWISRQARFREWAWLVYPLLVLIGLKMVAQDFKYSRPATLFIALAIYGAALIVAPRLRRGTGAAAAVRDAAA
jgi:hypothetical protein